MSGFWRTLQRLISGATASLNEPADPAAALDALFREQSRVLARLRADLATVVAAEKRLEGTAAQLTAQAGQEVERARQALREGDEGRARTLITRATAAEHNAHDVEQHRADVHRQRETLEVLLEEMRATIENLRVRREAARAQSAAARATISAHESVLPIGESGAERSLSLQDASDQLATMRARADALTELRHSPSMDAPGSSALDGPAVDPAEIDRRLAALRQSALP